MVVVTTSIWASPQLVLVACLLARSAVSLLPVVLVVLLVASARSRSKHCSRSNMCFLARGDPVRSIRLFKKKDFETTQISVRWLSTGSCYNFMAEVVSAGVSVSCINGLSEVLEGSAVEGGPAAVETAPLCFTCSGEVGPPEVRMLLDSAGDEEPQGMASLAPGVAPDTPCGGSDAAESEGCGGALGALVKGVGLAAGAGAGVTSGTAMERGKVPMIRTLRAQHKERAQRTEHRWVGKATCPPRKHPTRANKRNGWPLPLSQSARPVPLAVCHFSSRPGRHSWGSGGGGGVGRPLGAHTVSQDSCGNGARITRWRRWRVHGGSEPLKPATRETEEH